jgi:hypothetical protein
MHRRGYELLCESELEPPQRPLGVHMCVCVCLDKARVCQEQGVAVAWGDLPCAVLCCSFVLMFLCLDRIPSAPCAACGVHVTGPNALMSWSGYCFVCRTFFAAP